MQSKKVSFLGILISFLGLAIVASQIWQIFHFRYFHVASWGYFLLHLFLYLLVGAVFTALAVLSCRGYPASSQIFVGAGAFVLLLVTAVLSFALALPASTCSYTDDAQDYGKYDAAVSRLLSSELWRDFLPNALPENAVCISYSYTYENLLSDSVKIHATIRYTEESFEAETLRLKALEAQTPLNPKGVWSADSEALSISYSFQS